MDYFLHTSSRFASLDYHIRWHVSQNARSPHMQVGCVQTSAPSTQLKVRRFVSSCGNERQGHAATSGVLLTLGL